MKLLSGKWYHVYNRGNNKRQVFFNETNYLFFLEKVRRHILPCCDIMAYCLMPNHFHLLVAADERTEELVPNQTIPLNAFSNGIRHLLSSYTKAINKQEGFSGNLFQQKTRAKCVLDADVADNGSYAEICLHYIHQNALHADLVARLEDWQYSSFMDYAGLRKGTLCNVKRGLEHFEYDQGRFLEISYQVMNPGQIKAIF